MSNTKVWFVTGASKGLGLALVKKLLKQGYRVAATSRNRDTLTNTVGTADENFLPLQVNLADAQSVENGINETVRTFGRIDVVVNNAGYGIGGAIEELSTAEIDESFAINVHAVLNVVQKAMPHLRAQRSGYIINVSSIAGFAGAMGWSVYAAVKSAVIGFSEVLAQDVAGLGIKVTVVAPGAFRTSFLTEDSLVIAKNHIPDYTDVHASHEKYHAMDGVQAGDPDRAADVFIQLAESDKPPVRLFLGPDAYKRASDKAEAIRNDLEAWKNLSHSTNFAS